MFSLCFLIVSQPHTSAFTIDASQSTKGCAQQNAAKQRADTTRFHRHTHTHTHTARQRTPPTQSDNLRMNMMLSKQQKFCASGNRPRSQTRAQGHPRSLRAMHPSRLCAFGCERQADAVLAMASCPAALGARRSTQRFTSPRATNATANSSTAPAAVGVVIVDHGSRAKASNDMLLEFVDLYRATTGQPIVEPAHMELAEPSIADAVGEWHGASFFLHAGGLA